MAIVFVAVVRQSDGYVENTIIVDTDLGCPVPQGYLYLVVEPDEQGGCPVGPGDVYVNGVFTRPEQETP